MRLWHKDLIEVLPKQQLLGQWRECCLIAKELEEGTLNHILVNPIKNYPIEHFVRYCEIVYCEMIRRNYKVNLINLLNHISLGNESIILRDKDLFKDWHNSRYLKQCYYNLEEKHD